MKLYILEKPLSLYSRILTIGLKAHKPILEGQCAVVASSNHIKLIGHHREHKDKGMAYIWVVLDGFYLLSDSYRKITILGHLDFVDHVFIVGDCGSLTELQLISGIPSLRLLLDGNRIKPLISKLSRANLITRLKHQIPPGLFYEAWDFFKCLGIPSTPTASKGGLFFAGNDGSLGIQHVFTAIEAGEPGLISSELDPVLYQSRLDSALRQEKSLPELMLIGLDFYSSLSSVVISWLSDNTYWQRHAKASNTYSHDDLRIQCLQVILFKSIFRKTLLSWIAYHNLGVVITEPRRNKSFYAYARLNHLKMLDMGGLNGFEEVYPRYLDCLLYNKKILTLNSLCKDLYEATKSSDAAMYVNKSSAIEAHIRQSIRQQG